ncbi:uncharacterized protein [Marmota flaviventris]|uniref:uncharacterized protein n=1 Tax=Marmota flaviventris TaxID=93162 RepID=UPI003A8BF0EA
MKATVEVTNGRGDLTVVHKRIGIVNRITSLKNLIDEIVDTLGEGAFGKVVECIDHGMTALHYACAFGHPELVAFLVKKNCNVHLCDRDGNTPLMKALQYLEEKCATILLENGADPNAHNNQNETPLHFALSLKKTSLAEKLLSLNADIEARTTRGYTPLLLAIEQNRHQMVETLIQNKANIHAVDQKGRTALMFALEQKSKHIVEMLLQSGIDVSAADDFGQMALAYAIASGDTNLKELILQYMKVESKHPENINPVDEDSTDDNLKRISNKTDPDDHCLTLDEAKYKYYDKDIPKENGELPHTSNESKNDEETNETEEPKLKTLPGNCDGDIKKKNVIETTPVEEISIKNYQSIFSSSVGSKGFSQPKQGCTRAGEPSEDLTSHHLSSFLSLCVILTSLKLYCLFWTLSKQASIFFGDFNVKSFHPCLPGSVMEPFPEEEDMSLSPPQKCTGLLSDDAYQRADWGITRHIEEVKLLDVTSEEEEESLFGTENNPPQRVSEHHLTVGVSHISGEAYQREKRVDGYGEDVEIVFSHKSGSRNLTLDKPKDTGKEVSAWSHIVSRDSSDSWKENENAMKCKDFLPIKARREAWTKKSEKSHSDISLSKTHETPDGTGHNQKLSVCEKPPEVWASRISGGFHSRAKNRINGHREDAGHVSLYKGEKENIISPKTKEAGLEEVPRSHMGSKDVHASYKPTIKSKDTDPQKPKWKNGTKMLESDSPWDSSSEEEKEWPDGTVNRPQQSVCEKPPEVWASRISGGFHSRAKNRINGHREDAGHVSLYKGEKENIISPKTKEAGLEEVPRSHMGSKDVHASYKPTIKSKDTDPQKPKWKNGTKMLESDSPWDSSSEEEKEWPDGAVNRPQQSVCEKPPEVWASRISGGFHSRAKNRINGHREDAGHVSLYKGEKENIISPKTKEAGLEEVPRSHMGSKDVHASYKPTIKSKDTDPQKPKWKNGTKMLESDSPWDSSSEEEKEWPDGAVNRPQQSVCEKPPEVCASSISGESHSGAKNRINGHREDAGHVSLYKGEKENIISPKTKEAGLEEVPRSHMGSKDVHASYKPTIKSKDTDPQKPKWKNGTKMLESDSPWDSSSEEEKEWPDGAVNRPQQSVCEKPPEVWASRISGGFHSRAKNRINGHREDAGHVSLYKGEKENIISPKTKEAGLEEVPRSHMGSKDVHASYKPTIKSKDTDPQKPKWKNGTKMLESDSPWDSSSEEEKEWPDGAVNRPQQSVCEKPPEVWASRISGGFHSRAKNRINGHREDAGHVSLYKGEKENIISPKTKEAGLEEVPRSHMGSKDVHASYKPTIKSKDTDPQKPKWKNGTKMLESDSPWDSSSEEEKEWPDGAVNRPQQSVCEKPPEVWASRISGGFHSRAKNRINGHREDAGHVSLYKGEKENIISPKTKEAGLEEVPRSHMGSKDVHASYKPTIKSKDTDPQKPKWKNGTKMLESDSPWDSSSEEEKEWPDGAVNRPQQSVCEKPPEVCASSISGESHSGAKNRINGHREDAGHVSLYKGEKENIISPKTKEAGLEEVPRSHMGSKDVHASYKPTIKSKDTDPQKPKWKNGTKMLESDSPWDSSSEEEKEWPDGAVNRPQQSVCEKPPEVCASSISGESHSGAKNRINGHREDTGHVSLHKGEKENILLPKTKEAGLEDVPGSQTGSKDVHASYKPTTKSKDTDPKKPKRNNGTKTLESDTGHVSLHKGEKENILLPKTKEAGLEDVPGSQTGSKDVHASYKPTTKSKDTDPKKPKRNNGTKTLESDTGHVSLHKGEKENILLPKTKEAGLEDVPGSQTGSKDVHASYKPTTKSKDTDPKKPKRNNGTKTLESDTGHVSLHKGEKENILLPKTKEAGLEDVPGSQTGSKDVHASYKPTTKSKDTDPKKPKRNNGTKTLESDTGHVSLHKGEKENILLPKTKEAGLEDVPGSQTGSKDVHASYKPTTKSKDTDPKKPKRNNGTKTLESDTGHVSLHKGEKENILLPTTKEAGLEDVPGSQTGSKDVHASYKPTTKSKDTDPKKPKRNNGTKTLESDTGHVSLHKGEKENILLPTTKEAGLEDVPGSQTGSKDVHASYKPTTKSKDTDPKKPKRNNGTKTLESDTGHVSLHKGEKENILLPTTKEAGLEDVPGSQTGSKDVHASYKPTTKSKDTDPKKPKRNNGTKTLESDTGHVSLHKGEKENILLPTTKEAGLEDVPGSQTGSKDVHASYKPTTKSKDTDPKKPKRNNGTKTLESDTGHVSLHKGEKENILLPTTKEAGLEDVPGSQTGSKDVHASYKPTTKSKDTDPKKPKRNNGTKTLESDTGHVSLHKGEKENILLPKTKEAGLEDVPGSQTGSKDVHASYKPTTKSKDTDPKKPKRNNGTKTLESDTGHVSLHKGEKENILLPTTKEAGLEDVPGSQTGSKDVHASYKPTTKSKDTDPKKPKRNNGTKTLESDTGHVSLHKGEKENILLPTTKEAGLEDVPGSQTGSKDVHASYKPTTKSKDTDPKKPKRNNGTKTLESDTGHVSLHKGEKENILLPKIKEAGLEDVPGSQTDSKDVHASYKPTIKCKDTAPKNEKWMKGIKALKSESHWDKSSSEEKEFLDVTENRHQQSHSKQHPEVSASCISDMEQLSSHKTEKSNLMLFKPEDTGKGNAPFFHMESHLDISSEAKQKRPDDTGHSQQESDSEQDNECTSCLFGVFRSPTKKRIKGYVKGQKHSEETANGKGKRSTNSCGAFPKPTDVGSLSSHNRGKIKLVLVEPPDTGKEAISVSHMAESNLDRSYEAEQKRLHDMDDTAHHQQKSDSEKHQKICAACGSRTFKPSTKTINGHGQGKSEIRKTTEEGGVKTEKGNVILLSSYKRGNVQLMLVKRVDKGKDDTPVSHLEPHLDRSSEAEQKSFHDIDDTAHRQQKSDSEQLREECAAGVSSKFDPSTKTISGHGQGKFEIRKKTEEEGMKTEKGKSHLGKSSQEEKQSLEDTEYSQLQSDSEQLQEMCAASESVEINASTRKGISELGKVHRGLCDSFKRMNKIEDSLPIRAKLMMETWNFKLESHVGGSSNAEQKRLHNMDDTAHSQQKSDSEKHREVCAACVSSQFEPSTKAINGHGQGKSEIRQRIEEGKVKAEKGVSQNSHASGKHMKPSIIIKDSLLCKSKQKQERRTLKSGSSHHIIKHKKRYCSQCLLQKNAKLENELYELEKKYAEVKSVTSELKKENVACKQELQNIRDKLNEITNEDNKGIKKKPETSVRKFDTELNITADEFNQVSQLEMTTSDLENEIGQKRDTLRVRTLVSEQEKRHTYQNEQREMEEHIRKQESIRERRICRLQSEITQLEQEFHDLKNKLENQIDTFTHNQNQSSNIIRQLQAQNERYRLFLESRNIRLIHENSLLQKDSSMKRESRK